MEPNELPKEDQLDERLLVKLPDEKFRLEEDDEILRLLLLREELLDERLEDRLEELLDDRLEDLLEELLG